jgi:hypothetical protein
MQDITQLYYAIEDLGTFSALIGISANFFSTQFEERYSDGTQLLQLIMEVYFP